MFAYHHSNAIHHLKQKTVTKDDNNSNNGHIQKIFTADQSGSDSINTIEITNVNGNKQQVIANHIVIIRHPPQNENQPMEKLLLELYHEATVTIET